MLHLPVLTDTSEVQSGCNRGSAPYNISASHASVPCAKYYVQRTAYSVAAPVVPLAQGARGAEPTLSGNTAASQLPGPSATSRATTGFVRITRGS